MSNDIQKADQIAYRFYTKLTVLIANSRLTEPVKSIPKQDKWFNIELPESDLFKDHLRIYRSVSATPPPPTFHLQVLLAIPDLAQNQALVHLQPDLSSRLRLEPTPRLILLESWRLAFAPNPYPEDDVAPSTIYKHGIPLFRSLFSLLRTLPAWTLCKRLRRRTPLNGALAGSIQLRVHGLPTHDPPNTVILGFDSAPAPNRAPLAHQTHAFPPIPHPSGALALSATYLTAPTFHLDALESLLSSRFLAEGPEFTPTLAKHQHQPPHQYDRHTLSVSTDASLPARTSLPRSPSPQLSLAERFILPPRESPRAGAVPLPAHLPRYSPTPPTAATTSAISVPGGSPHDLPPRSASGLAARLRRESLGRVSTADLPSAPGLFARLPFPSPPSPSYSSHGPAPASPTSAPLSLASASPLPIRPANPVHPFKASALSGSAHLPHAHSHSPSPSLRGPSPLSSLGAAQPFRARPGSGDRRASGLGSGAGAGFGFREGFGEEREREKESEREERLDGAGAFEGTSPKNVAGVGRARKRYWSSFGDRYAAGGSEGSSGTSGGKDRARERSAGEGRSSASFLAATDDDDISRFVQDIDARAPLHGHRRGGSPSPGPMLTREVDVDERLRRMNAAFVASLEGLGGTSAGSGRRGRGRGRGGEDETRSASAGSGSWAGRAGGVAWRERVPPALRLDGAEGGLLLRRASGSRSGSTSASAQGSDEVIGRLELGDGRRR